MLGLSFPSGQDPAIIKEVAIKCYKHPTVCVQIKNQGEMRILTQKRVMQGGEQKSEKLGRRFLNPFEMCRDTFKDHL